MMLALSTLEPKILFEDRVYERYELVEKLEDRVIPMLKEYGLPNRYKKVIGAQYEEYG